MSLKCEVLNYDDVNFENVAALFRKNLATNEFSSTYFKWRYSRSFGFETTVIHLINAGEVVGLAAIFWNRSLANKTITAQIGDLLIDKDHRSLKAINLIYASLKINLNRFGDVLVFTTPNKKAELLNNRFLSLTFRTHIKPRFGFTMGKSSKQINSSIYKDGNPNKLLIRHAGELGELITYKRKIGPFSLVMIMQLNAANKRNALKLLASSAYYHKCNLFCNFRLDKSSNYNVGFHLPIISKKKTILVQSNQALDLNKLELMDLDGYA